MAMSPEELARIRDMMMATGGKLTTKAAAEQNNPAIITKITPETPLMPEPRAAGMDPNVKAGLLLGGFGIGLWFFLKS